MVVFILQHEIVKENIFNVDLQLDARPCEATATNESRLQILFSNDIANRLHG
jgi:hypothetical protein